MSLVCSDKANPSLRYWADGPTGKMSTKFWGVERKAKLGAWGAVLPPDILGRKVTVGWFSEELAAARARDAAVLAVMGPHQHMNWFVEEYSAGEVELAGRIMAARLKWEEQQPKPGFGQELQHEQQQEKRVVGKGALGKQDGAQHQEGNTSSKVRKQKWGLKVGHGWEHGGKEVEVGGQEQQQKQHIINQMDLAGPSTAKFADSARRNQAQKAVHWKQQGRQVLGLGHKDTAGQLPKQHKQQGKLNQQQGDNQHEQQQQELELAALGLVGPVFKRARTARRRSPGSSWQLLQAMHQQQREQGGAEGLCRGSGVGWQEEEAEGSEDVDLEELLLKRTVARRAAKQHGDLKKWQQLMQQVGCHTGSDEGEGYLDSGSERQLLGPGDVNGGVQLEGQGVQHGVQWYHPHKERQGTQVQKEEVADRVSRHRSSAKARQRQREEQPEQQQERYGTTAAVTAADDMAVLGSGGAYHEMCNAECSSYVAEVAAAGTAGAGAAVEAGQGFDVLASSYVPEEPALDLKLPRAWRPVLMEQEATSSAAPAVVEVDVSSCSSRAPQHAAAAAASRGAGAAKGAESAATTTRANSARVGGAEAAVGLEADSAQIGRCIGGLHAGEQQQESLVRARRGSTPCSSISGAAPMAAALPQSAQAAVAARGMGRMPAASSCCLQAPCRSAGATGSRQQQQQRTRSPSPCSVVTRSGKAGNVKPGKAAKAGKTGKTGKAAKPPQYHWWQKFRSWNLANYKAAAEATATALGCQVVPTGDGVGGTGAPCIGAGGPGQVPAAPAVGEGPSVLVVAPAAGVIARVAAGAAAEAQEAGEDILREGVQVTDVAQHPAAVPVQLRAGGGMFEGGCCRGELQQPLGTARGEECAGPSPTAAAVGNSGEGGVMPAACAAAAAAVTEAYEMVRWHAGPATSSADAAAAGAAAAVSNPLGEMAACRPAEEHSLCVGAPEVHSEVPDSCTVSCSNSITSGKSSGSRATPEPSFEGVDEDDGVSAAAVDGGSIGAAAPTAPSVPADPHCAAVAATAAVAISGGCPPTNAAGNVSSMATYGRRAALLEEATAELVVLVVLHERGWPNAQMWRQWEAYHEGRVVVVVHFKAGLQLVAGLVGHEEIARRMLDTRVEAKWGDISLTGGLGQVGYRGKTLSILHSRLRH